jgi:hypothetical protein
VKKGGGLRAPLLHAVTAWNYFFFAVVRLFLVVVRFGEARRAVVLFAGRLAAVVRFRLLVVRLRAVAFLRPAAFLRPVVFLRAVVFFLRAVDFLRPAAFLRPVVFRLAVDFLRAVVFLRAGFRAAAFFLPVVFLRAVDLRAVDFLRLAAMCHLPPALRTPCASGVVSPVRSCLPKRRTARRDAARS